MATSSVSWPRRVHLPFGYIVKIRIVSVSHPSLVEDVDGTWDVDSKTIYIRKSLSRSRRSYILLHELSHALNDCLHHFLDMGIADP